MALRQDICAAMRELVRTGLNRGTAGNISVREGMNMLITPSGVPPEEITPDMIARIPLTEDPRAEGPLKPSVEWRFHRAILANRVDIGAVVHTHAPWCTVLACARRPIPGLHYMVTRLGGQDIRVADYALYGTDALSASILAAMQDRLGCLMANHGMLAAGKTLAHAMANAEEMESLAHTYVHSLMIGGPALLNDDELTAARDGLAHYGKRESGNAG
ncbi:MAG: class II aldolase/adducin family protein [Pseudorhodobacter sp.]